MATGRKSDFTLPTFDSIFSTQEQRDDAKLAKIRDIPLNEIDDFPDHPFKVRDDEDSRTHTEISKLTNTFKVECQLMKISKKIAFLLIKMASLLIGEKIG